MDPKTIHDFLRPSLEGLTQKDKQELCRLIMGEPQPDRNSEDQARLRRIADKKRRLLKTGLFKN